MCLEEEEAGLGVSIGPRRPGRSHAGSSEATIDADGQRLAHVALANSQQRATLYAEDFERLMAAGFSAHWQYTEDGRGSAYPTVSAYTREGQQRMVPVARLIVGAGHGERVRASDGRTLNLRRENLDVYLGAAWFDASDWFPTVEALRAAGIEPVQRKDRTRRGRHRRAPQAAGTGAPASAMQHAPCTTPAGAPREPLEAIGNPPAPMPQVVTHVPRVIDRAALSARVREQMAQQRSQRPHQREHAQQ